VLRFPSFFRSVIDWDETIYFMMAEAWRAGHLPYTTLWDIKPIGLFAIFAVFQTIFGDHVYAMRIASIVASAATGFLLCLILRRLDRAPGGPRWSFGLFGGIVYVLCSIFDGGISANAELFFAPFTSGAVLLALAPRWRARPALQAFVAGLLIGVAGAVKYVALAEGLPVLMALLLAAGDARGSLGRRLWTALWPLVLGAAIPLLLPVPLYWLTGHLQDFLDNTVYSVLRRAEIGYPFHVGRALMAWVNQIRTLSPLYLAAAFLVLATLGRRDAGRPGFLGARDALASAVILSWLLAAFVGVASLQFRYVHYFLELLPPLAVATGWVAMRLLDGAGTRARAAVAAILALVLAAQLSSAASIEKETLKPVVNAKMPGIGWLRDGPAQIAAAIRPELAAHPGAILYVFDYEPILYHLARAVPPTRYAWPAYLVSRKLAQFSNIDVARAFDAIMAQKPYLIVVARNTTWHSPEDHTHVAYARIGPELAAHYELWKTFDEAWVYRRRAP